LRDVTFGRFGPADSCKSDMSEPLRRMLLRNVNEDVELLVEVGALKFFPADLLCRS
jgi:hypothetical protein